MVDNANRKLFSEISEDIVKKLFEISGYEVYRFGYEFTLPEIAKKFRSFKKDCKAIKKIRCMPDFFVFDSDKGEGFFVEVKARDTKNLKKVEIHNLDNYKKHWEDTILVIVVPTKMVFYTSKVKDLSEKRKYHDLESEYFDKIDDAFSKITFENVKKVRDFVYKINDSNLFYW